MKLMSIVAGELSTNKDLIELLFQRRVMKMRVIKLRQFKAVQPHLADRAARGARMTSTWGGNSSRP